MHLYPHSKKMGAYFLMKQVTIKLSVVSSCALWQQRNAVQFDRHSSYVSTRTQQETHILRHDMRSCAVMFSWTEV